MQQAATQAAADIALISIDPSDSSQALSLCSHKAAHILLDIHEALLVKIELDSAIDNEPFGQIQSANKAQM